MLYPQSNDKIKRPKPHQLSAIALTAMTLYSSGISAAEIDQQMFSFGGFGSLGVVHSSESRADFRGTVPQPNGAGFSRSWSADVDSRVGGQVDARITNQLSAVLQVIAEQQWDNSYTPKVEWANLKYAFTPDFGVRAGRIALPVFLFSDSRKVGYTTPWVRPPAETYQLLPLTNSDGLDVTYRFQFGKVKNTVTGIVGRAKATYPGGTSSGFLIKGNDIAGIVDTIKYGDLSLQASYLKTKLALPGLAAVPVPAISSLAEKSAYNFKLLGASYDPGKWFLMGEWAKSRADINGVRSGWYVTGGWRFDKLSPYATYAEQKQITTGVLNPPYGQKSASVGVRWDWRDNVDVKLQYDRINHDANLPETLLPRQGFQPSGHINVISAVIDFAF